jgi:uncharacterized protein YprB with RNaseH-like and TPR domain
VPSPPECIVREESSREALRGCEATNAAGSHWLIEEPLDQLCRTVPTTSADHASTGEDRSASRAQRGELATLRQHFPRSSLFFDLETCGFAGSAVFLIGIVHCSGSTAVVSQFLARNYAEERSILEAFWARVKGQYVVVSFNGKSFDWPMLQDRSVLHRLSTGATSDLVHCDLLHHARRRWRAALPDCKLQTLERWLCGRHRAGDIPGRQIPEAYHRYVRTGETGQLRAILHHNVLDLVTLVQLARQLVA